VQTEPVLAFARETHDAPGLEIVVNFGVFAGREATAAEIEELAKALLPRVGEVSIVSEQRHEIGEEAEAEVHQVRVEIRDDQLPADGGERAELRGRLLELAEQWARACIAERHAEVSEL
jgi:hypothetical protein